MIFGRKEYGHGKLRRMWKYHQWSSRNVPSLLYLIANAKRWSKKPISWETQYRTRHDTGSFGPFSIPDWPLLRVIYLFSAIEPFFEPTVWCRSCYYRESCEEIEGIGRVLRRYGSLQGSFLLSGGWHKYELSSEHKNTPAGGQGGEVWWNLTFPEWRYPWSGNCLRILLTGRQSLWTSTGRTLCIWMGPHLRHQKNQKKGTCKPLRWAGSLQFIDKFYMEYLLGNIWESKPTSKSTSMFLFFVHNRALMIIFAVPRPMQPVFCCMPWCFPGP